MSSSHGELMPCSTTLLELLSTWPVWLRFPSAIESAQSDEIVACSNRGRAQGLHAGMCVGEAE